MLLIQFALRGKKRDTQKACLLLDQIKREKGVW